MVRRVWLYLALHQHLPEEAGDPGATADAELARRGEEMTDQGLAELLVARGSVAPPQVAPMIGEREREATDNLADTPWLVIVWNDPINLMSYVTYVLQKLFGYSLEKATKLMLDVHHKGRAVVSSGSREKAEGDVTRLHSHGLWATMEQS